MTSPAGSHESHEIGHPLGAGVGAVGYGVIGTASGLALGAMLGEQAAPLTAAFGAMVGAVVGGITGSHVAERIEPTHGAPAHPAPVVVEMHRGSGEGLILEDSLLVPELDPQFQQPVTRAE